MTDDVYARMRDAVLSMLPPSIPLDDAITTRITVGPPRDPTHGDMTTNAAMVLAPLARKNPRELALEIVGRLRALPQIIDVDVAGPGFINIRVKLAEFQTTLPEILRVGVAYGDSTIGNGNAGQRRIRLRQSHRPDAYRPLPRRRRRRCAGQPARPRPATTSPRSTTSTTPARRSPRSPGRPIGATSRRSAHR